MPSGSLDGILEQKGDIFKNVQANLNVIRTLTKNSWKTGDKGKDILFYSLKGWS